MKTVILSATFAAVALQCAFAQSAGIRLGEPRPTRGTARLYITPMPGQVPTSLQEMSNSSALIIDGTVKATLPVRETSPRALETDAIIVINRTLKGPDRLREIVISQRGGVSGGLVVTPAQYALVRPGERYILFLVDDKRANIPPRAGLTRYLVTGIWSGLFFFENGKMRVIADNPDTLRKKYEGLSLEQITAEVAKVVRP